MSTSWKFHVVVRNNLQIWSIVKGLNILFSSEAILKVHLNNLCMLQAAQVSIFSLKMVLGSIMTSKPSISGEKSKFRGEIV